MRDIEGWMYRYFQDVVPYGTTDLRVNCPFCWARYGKEDTNHKLHVSLVKETAHCFRCDYSSSWVRLVMDVMDEGYAHALGELYTSPKAVSTEELISKFDAIDRVAESDLTLPDDFELLYMAKPCSSKCYSVNNRIKRRARYYLRRRGFRQIVWRRYNLGVARSVGLRVVIPIEGDFWQARALFDWVVPKYISPKKEARHILFNSIALRIYDEVVICEGAFSAMAVGGNSIALLRKKATSEQLARLIGSDVEKFIVALDSDAKMESVELARDLTRGGKQVTIWQYADGDPADGGDYISKGYGLRMEVEARLGGSGQGIARRIRCQR